MSEGRSGKSTVYVGGLAEEVDESVLIEVFSTFGTYVCRPRPSFGSRALNQPLVLVCFTSPGDIMDVQLPTHDNRNFSQGPQERRQADANGARRWFGVA